MWNDPTKPSSGNGVETSATTASEAVTMLLPLSLPPLPSIRTTSSTSAVSLIAEAIAIAEEE